MASLPQLHLHHKVWIGGGFPKKNQGAVSRKGKDGRMSETIKGGETEAEAVELRKRMRELEEVPFELLPWRCGAGP